MGVEFVSKSSRMPTPPFGLTLELLIDCDAGRCSFEVVQNGVFDASGRIYDWPKPPRVGPLEASPPTL